ncbi:M20 family metallopeptidase [Companilactobacillus sp. HBUAS56257]|uniref:M20 family metallopeptidase n=1 Tax=Companilactobacillus sp. HBUAS56257 TaxID=3109360 RepID=UPI002FF03CC8
MEKFITTEIQDEAIAGLKKIVGVASFNEPAEDKAPFGKGPKKALEEVLKVVEKLGFKTYLDPEGYYAYADIGSGDETFGIVGHMDEVPAGNLDAWDTDPYELTQKDGKLYGRGTQDDKGPTMAAIYAVKAILDKGYKFNKKIRFIFGSDEEILWRCLEQYNKKEDPIDLGISPDAQFPVIYAEKGLQQSYLVGPGSNELHLNLENAFNAVPGKAVYDGPKQDEVFAALQKHNFEADKKENSIEVHGRSVHAMNAPQGVNAVVRLAIALSDVYPDIKVLQFFKKFGEDANATNLLGDISDEASGKLTFNISSLKITDQESRVQIDMRIPVTVDHDELVEKVSQAVKPFEMKYEHFDYLEPLYVPTDSELVQTLMATYKDLTGDKDAKPLISGGATFARTMHNCVAFGGMLPTTPDFMHQANENWSVADMKKTMEIFAEAIYRLCVE